jgi:hypothetical protein
MVANRILPVTMPMPELVEQLNAFRPVTSNVTDNRRAARQ